MWKQKRFRLYRFIVKRIDQLKIPEAVMLHIHKNDSTGFTGFIGFIYDER